MSRRNAAHPPRPRFRSAPKHDRDYRARVSRAFRAFHKGPHTLKSLLKVKTPKPRHLDQWGRWTWDANRLVLVFKSAWRNWTTEVDPERMHTCAQALDAIFQLAGKDERLVSRSDVGDLVDALRDLIDPQANLCSWGINKEFNPTLWLTGERREPHRARMSGGHPHGR